MMTAADVTHGPGWQPANLQVQSSVSSPLWQVLVPKASVWAKLPWCTACVQWVGMKKAIHLSRYSCSDLHRGKQAGDGVSEQLALFCISPASKTL